MRYFPVPDRQNTVPEVELILMPLQSTEGGGQVEGTAAGERESSAGRRSTRRSRDVQVADVRLPMLHEFLRLGNLEPNSRRAYERALRRFLSWSNEPLAELKPGRIAQYRLWLESTPSPHTGKPLSRNSVNQEMAALKRFLGWLNQYYPSHCPSNPAALIRQRQVTLTTPQDISSEALECLLDHLPNLGAMAQRDRALIHLLLHGLRASEAVALNLSSFDGENLFIAQTKTHISRIVPLSRSSQECLNDYIQWRRQELQEATSPDAPLLMAQGYRTAGRRLSYSGLYQAVERIGRSAAQSYLDTWKADHSSAQLEDLPDPVSRVIEQLRQLHPHNFRHTYATGLLLRGLDPAHARKLTGHQSQQVFRRYTERAEQEAVINAFRRLDNQQPWLP